MHPRTRPLRAASALVAVATAALAPAQEWPTFRANAAHTAAIPNLIRIDSIDFEWQRPMSGPTSKPFIAKDGMIHVIGPGPALFGLSPTSGGEKWRSSLSGSHNSPPFLADGTLWVVRDGLHLQYRDPTTGENTRNVSLGIGGSARMLTWFDGTLYGNCVGSNDVMALDPVAGTLRWGKEATAETYYDWCPAVDESACYSYFGGMLVASSLSDGTELFRIGVEDDEITIGGYMAPVIGGMDDVLAGQGELTRFCLSERRAVYTISDVVGMPAVGDGIVYVVVADKLQAHDQLSGEKLWDWSFPGVELVEVAALTGGHVIVSATDRTLIVDIETHQLVYTSHRNGQVVVADNMILIRSSDFYVNVYGMLTGLSFEQLPRPLAAAPARARFDQLPTTVQVSGTAFEQTDNLRVFVADVEVAPTVIDDETLSFTPPALQPGIWPIRTEGNHGGGTLDQGFIACPAVEVTGATEIGGTLVCRFHVREQDHLLALVGLPKPPTAAPPFLGQFELTAQMELGIVPFWPEPEFELEVPIPFLPVLRGYELAVQGLAIPNSPRDIPGALTNAERFVLE